VLAVPAGGTYSPSQMLLLKLSGPLGGEDGRGRKERQREE